MRTFIFVYLVGVLVNVLLTATLYFINPKSFDGCDFGLLTNTIAFFLWPVVWGKAVIEYIFRK